MNAFLLDIAPKEKIGRVSGYGWSLGYVGGLIALIIGYFYFVNPEIDERSNNKDYQLALKMLENWKSKNTVVSDLPNESKPKMLFIVGVAKYKP